MKKVTLIVPWGQYDPIPWGQYDPIVKKEPELKHSLLQCFSPPNNISQDRFVLKYRQTDRHDCVLGNLEYIEAGREIYRKCITKRKQYARSKKRF
jgi:hypothetical protein